jgi:molybdopterin converting factor small subunit
MELEDESSLKDLISELAEETENSRQGYIGRYKLGSRELVILLNGRNHSAPEKLNTPLVEGDVVALFPPVEGGSTPSYV